MLRPVCLAYACEPNVGSESELGWMWSNIIGDFTNPVVITRNLSYQKLPGNSIVSSDFGEVKLHNNVVFKNIDIPILKGISGGHYFLICHYLIWQAIATVWIFTKKKHFSIAHHINFVAAWLPPFVSLIKLPVIWGPVGTGAGLPKWARKTLKAKLWNIVTQNPGVFPFYKALTGRCKVVLTINSHVAELISSKRFPLVRTFPAVAFDSYGSIVASYRQINESTIIYAGRHMPFKFPELAALCGKYLTEKYNGLRFIMIGDGLKDNLSSSFPNIEFVEKLERKDFLNMLSKAQLLLLPTTEGSSYVALEALSYGLPIVTTENSGPAFFIGSSAGRISGLKESEEETAQSLANNCAELLANKNEWAKASVSALDRAKLFAAGNLRINIESVYREIMND